MRGGERRPKCPSGVQGRAGKRPGDENAEGNREADAKAGDGAKRAFFIDGGGEYCKHEEESGYGFESHACPPRKIAGQFRCAQDDGTPGLFGNHGLQQKRSGSRAGKLRGPIQYGVHGVQTLGDPEADGDRGIEMSAGNVAERGNHDADGEAVGEGDAEKTEAARAVKILIRANRAGVEKNQRKRSEEFCDQFLRRAVDR